MRRAHGRVISALAGGLLVVVVVACSSPTPWPPTVQSGAGAGGGGASVKSADSGTTTTTGDSGGGGADGGTLTCSVSSTECDFAVTPFTCSNGLTSTPCPSTNLLGCCVMTVSGTADVEACFYVGSVATASTSTGCAAASGTWKTTM